MLKAGEGRLSQGVRMMEAALTSALKLSQSESAPTEVLLSQIKAP